MKALGNGEFCKKQGGIQERDCRGCGRQEARQGGGTRMGHGRTCKSSSMNCPDFTGKSERAAWIFPRSPKETTPGEKERP